jgi:hypothetical protein
MTVKENHLLVVRFIVNELSQVLNISFAHSTNNQETMYQFRLKLYRLQSIHMKFKSDRISTQENLSALTKWPRYTPWRRFG